MRGKKRSQVTVFIVIGLLLLLALAVIIFIYNKWTYRFVPTEVVPQNVLPVQRYVESCAEESLRDGLVTLGLQGGFIDIPPKIEYTPTSYINLGDVQKIPLWRFRDENRMPTFDFMEQELLDHIKSDMGYCVEGLSMFNEFQIYNMSPAIPKLIFGEDDVTLTLNLPMSITDKSDKQETKIRDFYAQVPVRIRKIYDLAKKTFETEMRDWFLENITMELMTSDAEFPFTGMEFKCGTVRWYTKDLKERLQDHLFYNLPRIRVKGTNHTPFFRPIEEYERIEQKSKEIRSLLYEAEYTGSDPLPAIVDEVGIDEVPEDMYEYTHLYVDVDNQLPGVVEKFIYVPSYGMDFTVRPSEGGIMSSKQTKGALQYLSFLCMNFYHFAYDIKYPVEVRIVDRHSLADEGGYMFRFGMPVTIRNNEGFKDAFGYSIFDSSTADYQFCDILTEDEVEIEVKGVFEGYTDQPIEGVNLTYVCVSHYCDLGRTESMDGTFKYKGPVPSSCTNAVIKADKPGYLQSEAILTGDELTMHIDKLRSLDMEFRKKIYTKDVGLSQGYSDLEDDEEVVLYLNYQGKGHEQFITYPFRNLTDEFTKINFIEAGSSYSMNAMLLDGNETIGGYMNENLTVSYDRIAGKDKIIITLVEYKPEPTTDEELGEMLTYIYSGDYLPSTEPQFG